MPREAEIIMLNQHRGIRVIGSVDQALIDGAHPLIPPEMLARLNGDDDAVLAIRDRLNREARHVVIEPTWRDELAEDWRDFASEVRRSPVSHALVAVLTVVCWTVALLAPIIVLGWLS